MSYCIKLVSIRRLLRKHSGSLWVDYFLVLMMHEEKHSLNRESLCYAYIFEKLFYMNSLLFFFSLVSNNLSIQSFLRKFALEASPPHSSSWPRYDHMPLKRPEKADWRTHLVSNYRPILFVFCQLLRTISLESLQKTSGYQLEVNERSTLWPINN